MTATLEERFAELYREHAGILVKTTQAFVVDRADRDDLFQEMLIALWQALPQFDGRAKLSTYVYRVTLSCALNWKRSRRRYRQRLDQYGRVLPEWPEAPTGCDRERLNWLYARIHALPPVDRSLILLSLDRLSYGEIAEVTGLSESNVGVRLHRIRQQLTAQSEEIKNAI